MAENWQQGTCVNNDCGGIDSRQSLGGGELHRKICEENMGADVIAAFWAAGSLAIVAIGMWLVLIWMEKHTPKGG